MSTNEKTTHTLYKGMGRGARGTNDKIKTHAISSKDYVMCYGGWEALEEHDEQAISTR